MEWNRVFKGKPHPLLAGCIPGNYNVENITLSLYSRGSKFTKQVNRDFLILALIFHKLQTWIAIVVFHFGCKSLFLTKRFLGRLHDGAIVSFITRSPK